MKQQPSSPSQQWKAIKLLFLALALAQLFFAGSCYWVAQNNIFLSADTISLVNLAQYVIPFLLLPIAYLSIKLFERQIARIKNTTPPLSFKDQLSGFYFASAVRWLLLESYNIFSLILYLLTANPNYLIIFAVGYVFFLSTAPVAHKCATYLELSEQQLLQLET